MFKVGCDICSVKRISRVYGKYGTRFLSRILSEQEKQYVLSSRASLTQTLAGRFAAKEAIAKALGVGWRGISFKEVEIVRQPSGAPRVVLHKRAKLLAQRLNLTDFEVSISHEKEFAIAYVIAYSAAAVRSSRQTPSA
jgi:holo-[acyl-carrier protein] synthase